MPQPDPMTALKPVGLLILVAACSVGPTAPAGEQPARLAAELTADGQAASLILSVPGQLVTTEQAGVLERAWVSAQITVGTDRVPISDGAILVVSAADGPMPQSDPDAESLSIQVRSAVVDATGTVRFEGVATTTVGRVVSLPFEITGTARPAAAPSEPQPDYIVWDIVGGNLQEVLTFTTRAVVRHRTEDTKPQ